MCTRHQSRTSGRRAIYLKYLSLDAINLGDQQANHHDNAMHFKPQLFDGKNATASACISHWKAVR
jgi:hypothetical protein